MSLFDSQPALFAFLATIVAVIFQLARLPQLKRFFHFLPPLIWTYFVPMACSSLGIIPNASPLYSFIMVTFLPMVIILLLIPSDIRSIIRLGPKAVGMLLIGTFGIVVGAAASFAFFLYLLPDGTLPPDLWKGVASLSGSWIGGSPNMAAIAKSLELEQTLFLKMVVVDTLCAYTWLGVLIALIAWQKPIDRFNRADASMVHALAARLTEQHAERARPLQLTDFLTILAVGFAVSQLCLGMGRWLGMVVEYSENLGGSLKLVSIAEIVFGRVYDIPQAWRPYEWMDRLDLSQVLSGFGWGILITTFAGVSLSFTGLRRLDDVGATPIGYAGLYLLLTTFGAQADLRLIGKDDLWLLAVGALWLAIHILVMFIGAYFLRAPLFIVATASMANVGGTASAPVVAAAFDRSLAPVGLLLAILGGIIGTPVGLLIIAKTCALLAGA